jgi:Glycosyltransferase 61
VIFKSRSKARSRYYLRFDAGVTYGSPKHFFHFMWGYLLPAIYTINASTNPESSQYLFRSCGPVMDELTREVMSLCRYRFSIVPNILDDPNDVNENIGKRRRVSQTIQVIVPRWDIGLLRSHLLEQDTATYDRHTSKMRKQLTEHPLLLNLLQQKDFSSELSSAIAHVRSQILREIDALEDHSDFCTDFDAYAERYLLLERSPEPSEPSESGFYAKRGYGASRRALVGLEEEKQKLEQKNIPVKVFEPGRYKLAEQITVFQRCRGIVGIKGAEFANMIWLKPKSRVILIKPIRFNTPPVQAYLADMLELNYVEIETDQGPFPKLEHELVERYLV